MLAYHLLFCGHGDAVDMNIYVTFRIELVLRYQVNARLGLTSTDLLHGCGFLDDHGGAVKNIIGINGELGHLKKDIVF